MVWNLKNAECSFKNKFIVLFIIIFCTLSFPIVGASAFLTCSRWRLHLLVTVDFSCTPVSNSRKPDSCRQLLWHWDILKSNQSFCKYFNTVLAMVIRPVGYSVGPYYTDWISTPRAMLSETHNRRIICWRKRFGDVLIWSTICSNCEPQLQNR